MALTQDKKIMDFDTAESDPTPSRRTFLRWGIYAVGAGVTAVIAVPAVGYFIAPATSSESADVFVSVGKVTDFANQLEIKEKLLRDIAYTDSFKPATITRKVFIRATKSNAANAEDFLVLSSMCTHAGCPVSYRAAQKDLFCSCHGSQYDQDGFRTAGPAPRPLDKYEVKIEAGEIKINVFKSVERKA
ncbi:MAG: ubiquinol-cytochrome c reductase iron-sulfur subunit [Chloroflexi bacterium]|uniref:Ubiquinol-cytochrome c reductase iron-sulfur subunit n=1 Tax=Candidatus Chlorohelix allophototropha TaxID=3003348 RepID=A0A8T7M9Z6_9CHLR|nr:ubiquinol-cytochrome c reductase iron-sulfur subunit [Chloroflexota bacterium]WJW68879.1 ubiquinol-cytochrome c reductase iron-sulfur subunit [Chloroflexota bacterium L227-S17]